MRGANNFPYMKRQYNNINIDTKKAMWSILCFTWKSISLLYNDYSYLYSVYKIFVVKET